MSNFIIAKLFCVKWPDPHCEGEYGMYYAVGHKCQYHFEGELKSHIITAITMQEDVPGLHSTLRRICIWCGDKLVLEAPYHSIEYCQHLLEDN